MDAVARNRTAANGKSSITASENNKKAGALCSGLFLEGKNEEAAD